MSKFMESGRVARFINDETHAVYVGFKSGAREGTRTLTPFGTRPSNVCVYQFHHPSISNEGKAD